MDVLLHPIFVLFHSLFHLLVHSNIFNFWSKKLYFVTRFKIIPLLKCYYLRIFVIIQYKSDKIES